MENDYEPIKKKNYFTLKLLKEYRKTQVSRWFSHFDCAENNF